VTVRLGVAEDGARLAVHSFGPPIPPEVLPVIFDPYRRHPVRNERSKGLGLGLFITQQIVAAHGGRLDCQSTDAEGTTMTAVLPRGTDEKVSSLPAALVS
jgi:signal transduction histidine kinase